MKIKYFSLKGGGGGGGQKRTPQTPCKSATDTCLVDQGFSLASAIGHSPKIVPDVREFAVQFGQFVRDEFRKHMLYGNAQ